MALRDNRRLSRSVPRAAAAWSRPSAANRRRNWFLDSMTEMGRSLPLPGWMHGLKSRSRARSGRAVEQHVVGTGIRNGQNRQKVLPAVHAGHKNTVGMLEISQLALKGIIPLFAMQKVVSQSVHNNK